MEISSKKTKKKKTITENMLEDDITPVPSKKKKIKKEKELGDKIDKLFEHDEEENELKDTENDNDFQKLDEKDLEGDSWTKEDDIELIRRMESFLPKNDNLSFTSRVERLPWSQIQFGNHSSEECYEKWKILRTKVRHYRLLEEVLHDAKNWVENPYGPSRTKKRTTRHPDQPARPLSSFMLFYMQKKDKFIKRHPELKLTEVSVMLGEKYKALSEEKKAYYHEKAKHDAEEYKKNMIKFYENHPEISQPGKKESTKPVSNKPLPPMKLYLKHKLQKYEKNEDFNQQDFVEKYKEQWKNLSLKKKAYWIRVAQDEEEKYLVQQRHEHGYEGENKPTYKSVITKEERTLLDRLAGKPEKPPNSAYSLYSRLMLKNKDENHVYGEPKSRMKEVANMWKELPEETKKVYQEKVQLMTDNYKLEFAEYLESLPEEKRQEELAKLQPKKKNSKPLKPKKAVIKKVASTSESREGLFKNEPEKPPVTAWDLYKQEFIKKHKHLPSEVAFNDAATQWKTLSKNEIDKYKQKHKELKNKYMVDFEAFLKSLNEAELKEFSKEKNKSSQEDELDEESNDEDSSNDVEDNNGSSNSSEDSGVSEDES